jgi:hypothetical protein
LSWKKSCSPAVNTKSLPQSIHFRTLSWNSMECCSLQPLLPGRLVGSVCESGDGWISAMLQTYLSGTAPGFGPPCPTHGYNEYYCA